MRVASREPCSRYWAQRIAPRQCHEPQAKVPAASRITQSDPTRFARTKGGEMKYVTGLLAAILLTITASGASSAVRIAGDRGGKIGNYVMKYQRLASSGESVIIDGLCASACTIVLSALPPDKICVTSRATLGFHAAWNYGPDGRTFTDPEATLMLYSGYPTPVRRWIARRGGLRPGIIFLSGKPLQEMYRHC
jgi:hypothetical protein